MRSILFLSLLTFLGCTIKNTEEERVKSLPTQNFVFIEQEIDIIFCPTYLPNKCSNKTIEVNGSGVFVGRNIEEEKSYILTAEHICKEPEDPKPEAFLNQSILATRMIVNDSYGDKYKARVVRTDAETDLCLLEIDMIAPEPVLVAQEDPFQHDKIWNIAAPTAIWDPTSVIIFDGYFDGINKNNQSVYSMPTAPGSSGSPIFNRDNELVGIVSMYAVNWNVGFGAPRQDIANFVRVYMPESD